MICWSLGRQQVLQVNLLKHDGEASVKATVLAPTVTNSKVAEVFHPIKHEVDAIPVVTVGRHAPPRDGDGPKCAIVDVVSRVETKRRQLPKSAMNLELWACAVLYGCLKVDAGLLEHQGFVSDEICVGAVASDGICADSDGVMREHQEHDCNYRQKQSIPADVESCGCHPKKGDLSLKLSFLLSTTDLLLFR